MDKTELRRKADYAKKKHMASMEAWPHGRIKRIWEEEGSICVEYESGCWWHYRTRTDGEIEWW